MSLCEYKDIFGKPNEGAHSHRFLGLATVDLIGFVLLVFVIVSYFGTGVLSTTIWLAILTIFIHWLFCVPTALNRQLGLA